MSGVKSKTLEITWNFSLDICGGSNWAAWDQ